MQSSHDSVWSEKLVARSPQREKGGQFRPPSSDENLGLVATLSSSPMSSRVSEDSPRQRIALLSFAIVPEIFAIMMHVFPI
jgi:hypothetical protein